MPFWACLRLEARREHVAKRFLELAGYTEVYIPQIREQRIKGGRRCEVISPLFPSYGFIFLECWYAARWTIGVIDVLMDGAAPAKVPDRIITSIRAREINGLVTLPSRFKRGDKVRVVRGPFRERLALYDGMNGHERVAILLSLLGSERRLMVPRGDIEAV